MLPLQILFIGVNNATPTRSCPRVRVRVIDSLHLLHLGGVCLCIFVTYFIELLTLASKIMTTQ